MTAVLATGFAMVLHYWVRFRRTWVPATPPLRPTDVSDPAFRLWSWLKMGAARVCCCGRKPPSPDEVRRVFARYDKNGDGTMDVAGLARCLRDLNVLPPGYDPSTEASGRKSRIPAEDDEVASSTKHVRSAPPGLSEASSISRGTLSSRRIRHALQLLDAYGTSSNKRLSEEEFAELLTRIVTKMALLHPAPRMQGAWKVPLADNAEPARTERLLRRPFGVLHSYAADAKDSMSFHVFGKVSGGSFIGMCFAYVSFLLQCLLAVVSAVGPYLTRSTASANAQVLSVAAIKLLWVLILVKYLPSSCLLSNAVITVQFFFEAIAVLLVFAASQQGASGESMLLVAPFYLLLTPVFLPILQKVYDGIVINIITACCRKKFDCHAACAKLAILVLAMPSLIATFFGLGVPQSSNAAKLSNTSKGLILAAKSAKRFKIVNTKRVVRSRAIEAVELMADAGCFVRSQKPDEEDDDDDDIGDGGEADDGAD